MNVKDNYGGTVLMVATLTGYSDMVQVLLNKGADVNAVEERHDATALKVAETKGHTEIIEMLKKAGAKQ